MASVADWVAAIGTAGALLAAVYTLWRQVRADAQSQGRTTYIEFDYEQGEWSIANGGNFAVILREVRVIFKHPRGVIGEVIKPPNNDGWHFIRRSGWRITLPRLWYSYVRSEPLPDLKPANQKGSWTSLSRQGPLLLGPGKETPFPLPIFGRDVKGEEVTKDKVGAELLAGFTDSAGRNWWRIWPSGELRSVWDPDFWSPRRRKYINDAFQVMPLILVASGVTTILVSAPTWSIVASWVAFVLFLYPATRFFLSARDRPPEVGPIEPASRSHWDIRPVAKKL